MILKVIEVLWFGPILEQGKARGSIAKSSDRVQNPRDKLGDARTNSGQVRFCAAYTPADDAG